GKQRVGHADRELARVSLLAVLADVTKLDRRTVWPGDVLCLPDNLVESLEATMKRVGAVVHGQSVVAAVEREGPPGDAVGHAPDRGTEVGVAGEVAFQRVEAKDDVSRLPLPVRYVELGDDRAVRHHLDRHPTALEDVECDRGAVGYFPEVVFFKT